MFVASLALALCNLLAACHFRCARARGQAPRIELDEGSFLRIPDLSKLDAYNKKQQKKGLQGNGGGYATIEPGIARRRFVVKSSYKTQADGGFGRPGEGPRQRRALTALNFLSRLLVFVRSRFLFPALGVGPKKYSIEWLQEWKEKRSDGPAPVDPVLPLVATALCLGSLAFFAS